MKKERPALRKFLKITLTFFSSLLLLLLTLFLLLENSKVQTWLTEKISEYLSKEYGTTVSTGKVEISIFDGFRFEDLYIADQQNDTLFFINSIGIFPKGLPRSFSKLKFSKVNIDSLYCNLYELPDGQLNMQFLIDSLSGDEEDDEEAKFSLKIAKCLIKNSRFNYKEFATNEVEGINFADLGISNINIDLEDFELLNSDIKFKKLDLWANEKSGFEISKLNLYKGVLDGEGIKVKHLDLRTPKSLIDLRETKLLFADYDYFSEFADKVDIKSRISDSTDVAVSDINYFTMGNRIDGFQNVRLAGNLSGVLNDASIDELQVVLGNVLELEITSKIKNLTNIESLRFNVDFQKLKVNAGIIDRLQIPGIDSLFINLPQEVKNLGRVDYKGKAVGDIKNFYSVGELRGKFGKVEYRITSFNDTVNKYSFEGQIITKNIDINEIVEIPDFGQTSVEQDFKLHITKDDKLKIEAFGLIDTLEYRGYKYAYVSTVFKMHDSKIDSLKIAVKDENIDALIFGKINFQHKIPEFNITSDIKNIDLYALNLYREEYPANLNFKINTNFKGININDFEGEVKLTNPLNINFDTLSTTLDEFNLESKIVNLPGDKSKKQYTIVSQSVDAEVDVIGAEKKIISALQKTLAKYAPTLIPKDENNVENEPLELNANVEIKDASPILKFFLANMYIAPKTHLEANYNSQQNNLQIALHSPKFIVEEIPLKNIAINIKNTNDELNLNANFEKIKILKKHSIKHVTLRSRLHADSMNFNVYWDNLLDTLNTKADIDGMIVFKENAEANKIFEIDLGNSGLFLQDKEWNFNTNKITIDTSSIGISNIHIKHENQAINISGEIAHDPNSKLNVNFKNFNLNNLNPLMPTDMDIQGNMNGIFKIKNIYTDPILISNDTIENLKLNKISMGNMYLKSDWDSNCNGIKFAFYNKFGDEKKNQAVHITDSVYGTFFTAKNSIELYGFLNGFNLRTFKPIYKDEIDFARGSQVTGDFKMIGDLKNPKFEGDLALKITSLGIKYLSTRYSINKSLDVFFNNNIIKIDSTKIFSKAGGNAILYGGINHKNFDDFNFNIALQANKFQFMDMQATDTSMFFGSAYGSGIINMQGKQDDLKIDVDIKTDENTEFYIPLSSSETLDEEQSFMNFINTSSKNNYDKKNKVVKPKIKPVKKSETKISINMALAVTTGAEVQLIMDQQTGDVIKARGNGNLQINIGADGKLSMFGDYIIKEGDYLFSLQNLFSKHFTIKKGGTINWTGSPDQANIDISAVYSLSQVGVYGLLLNSMFQGAKTPVDCIIGMKGALMAPDIKFGVEFPKDEYRIKQHFRILEQDEVNEQFLSLLLIGNFQPLPGLSQENASNSIINIGELVTNSLNRHLSGISKNVDIGINYQTGTETTKDELEVELKTRLWNDRITIGTNWGAGGGLREENQEAQNRSIVGEIELNLKLNPEGTVQLKAFNKANDSYMYTNGLYTQGVGLFWRGEFDKIRILSKIRNKKAKDTIPNNKNIKSNKNKP